jgi:hypothetical protein
MSKSRILSPLALEIATEMNAGKSLEQIRTQRPDLTDAQINSFMKEMFALIGLAPTAATASADILRSKSRRDREFIDSHYFRLKVVLEDIKPQIWRHFVVPAAITLDRLHDCLQAIMGWTDCHLHSFTIDGNVFTENPEQAQDGMEETGVVLGTLVTKPRAKFTYLYDFGDSWMHTVTVQSVERIPDGSAVRMYCLAGQRRCPPEDVGGRRGYRNFLEVIGDPAHEERQSLLDWCGGSFNPREFDVDAVNVELLKVGRWSRLRR